MAKNPEKITHPTATRRSNAVERWAPPTTDQTFVFKDIESAPGWVDRSWASYDRGPALALPAGDIYGKPPYTTITARVGDKVVFTAANGAQPPKFTVIPALARSSPRSSRTPPSRTCSRPAT
jgi:hypothetical protein